nr:ATP-binding protein [Beijerinckia sp. L45]
MATLKILIFSCMGEEDLQHRGDLLHTMDISVSIMEDLLGALLQIGQLDAGRIAARITTFQLDSILDRLRIQFAHLAQEKGITLRIVGTRFAVVSDKALLERILSNIVANAVRYTDVGSVLVVCRARGAGVDIEVRDTGRGIESQHHAYIFDEFFQVPNTRRTKRPGLGLGLNIVKRVADILEHPIRLRSEPGRGSVFTVSVSIGDVWQSELAEPEISEAKGGEFAGLSVMLVEDDPELRRATHELLERWGMRVLAVASIAEALGSLGTQTLPRLVIADYSLNQELGTDAVHRLREATGSAIPAFIMTAEIDPAVVARIKAEGFSVLIKPVSPPRLRVLMHNLIFEPPAPTSAPTVDTP